MVSIYPLSEILDELIVDLQILFTQAVNILAHGLKTLLNQVDQAVVLRVT